MVQGEVNNGVTAVTSNSTKNTIPTRLFDENGLMDTNGEKKKKVGNYIISKTIGEGSFAKVRLGFHLITQQKVAVKVINKREVLKRNYLRANLRREACMMQRMQHPNIIQLYEVMETENCYYIVMELIEGIEFVKYLSKKRSLDENETRQYIRQIVSAVDHMHRAKVIHRDIKLQNFMLDQNYNLVIIDFGLSNCLDERDFLNTQCGSPAYAAPEIFAHQDYRAEVDIWSIGVNMYAMLAGKLPFKVENRSKNLAKLHACILKGCEIPNYLSPDCQDLLKRLLEPSPNLRIKMHEILAHPWLNYHSFPIEIIPYKPVVDIKEIKTNIVQYLIQKHDYSENDVIDAIVHRRPISIKAMYYLIEKRLKHGLSFPDIDFVLENNEINIEALSNKKSINGYGNNIINHNNNVTINNGVSSLTKHNSQLLPKRNNKETIIRTASQKNADVKHIYNNINSYNKNNEYDHQNINTLNPGRPESAFSSKSPSPDFSLAINPIRTNGTPSLNNNLLNNNINTTKNYDRRQNYHDIVYRKSNNLNSGNNLNGSANLNTNISNNNNNSNININNDLNNKNLTSIYASGDRTVTTANSNISKNDRYFIALSMNNTVQSTEDSMKTRQNIINSNNGVRSLPGSIYRGSPERSLPRSPDYTSNINNIAHGNRPTTSRIGSSKPSVISENSSSEKYYDSQKFKPNYYMSKRSMTSCDETGFDTRNRPTNILKSRQLQMGKAKIDLGTPQNLNVGVTVKNIGAYLKIPTGQTTETMKFANNSHTTSSNKSSNTNEQMKISKHSSSQKQNTPIPTNNRIQGTDSVNSLPRIRLSS